MSINTSRIFTLLYGEVFSVKDVTTALAYLRMRAPDVIRQELAGHSISSDDFDFLLNQAEELQQITLGATGPSVDKSAERLGDHPPGARTREGVPIINSASLFGLDQNVLVEITDNLREIEGISKGGNPFRAALLEFEMINLFMNLVKTEETLRERSSYSMALAMSGAASLVESMVTHSDNRNQLVENVGLLEEGASPFRDNKRITHWGLEGILAVLWIHSGSMNSSGALAYRPMNPPLAIAAMGQAIFDFTTASAGLHHLLKNGTITDKWERHLVAYTIDCLCRRVRQLRDDLVKYETQLEASPKKWSRDIVWVAKAQAASITQTLEELFRTRNPEEISKDLRSEFGEAMTATALLRENEYDTRQSSFWILDSLAILEAAFEGPVTLNPDWDEPGEVAYSIIHPAALKLSRLGIDFSNPEEVNFVLPERELNPDNRDKIHDQLLQIVNRVRDQAPFVATHIMTVTTGEMLRPYVRDASTGEFVPMRFSGGSSTSGGGDPTRNPTSGGRNDPDKAKSARHAKHDHHGPESSHPVETHAVDAVFAGMDTAAGLTEIVAELGI